MDKLLSDFRVCLSRHLSAKTMKAVRPFLTVQFVIFMGMGILNTAVSVITATVLDWLCTVLLAPESTTASFIEGARVNFICGYMASIVTSFFLNCRVTFHAKPTIKKFIVFPLSYIPNFLFQYLFVFIFTSLGRDKIIAYILAAVIGTPVTFAFMRFVVFRKNQSQQGG